MKILALIIVLLLAFYFSAYKARPAKDQNGQRITPPKQGFTKKKNRLVIGTYNVQSGKDNNGKRDINRSAEIIKSADIVGIQEVYAATWLGGKSQAQALAEYSNFGWLFAATRKRWFREHRGNALLSRLPVNKWSIEMLPDLTGKQYRNLITALINFDGQEVAILVTHLHTKKGKEEQLAFVLEKFKSYERAILVGDMNTPTDNVMIQTLLQDSTYVDAIQTANIGDTTDNRIDWILTKGFNIETGKFEPIGVSDHPYYQVELSLAPINNIKIHSKTSEF